MKRLIRNVQILRESPKKEEKNIKWERKKKNYYNWIKYYWKIVRAGQIIKWTVWIFIWYASQKLRLWIDEHFYIIEVLKFFKFIVGLAMISSNTKHSSIANYCWSNNHNFKFKFDFFSILIFKHWDEALEVLKQLYTV